MKWFGSQDVPEWGTRPEEDTALRRQLMTAEETAAWLNIRLGRLYELVRREQIPYTRFGRALRFYPDALDEWLRAGGTGYEGPEAA